MTREAVWLLVGLLCVQRSPVESSEHAKDVCRLPPGEVGNCDGVYPRWTFDENGCCVEFEYGGCGGNGNNFETEAECQRTCLPSADICKLPVVVGPCEAAIPRWASKNGVCQEFTYGGCYGNANNFETKAECERACPPEEDVCSLPAETGRCRAYIPRWASVNGVCEEFIYGGCGGNGNNFETEEECERACPEACSQPIKPGPCKASIPRWGFQNGECVEFIYGGCQGNNNRFSTQEECEQACEVSSTRPDQCYYRRIRYCSASRRVYRWVYNDQTDTCVRRRVCRRGYSLLPGYRLKRECENNCVI